MRLSRQSCNGIKPNNTHIYIIGGSYVLPPIIVSILPCLLLLCQFCPSRNAKHCMCQRKALQPSTQSFATANAKLCICPRKALHPLTQTFAGKGAFILESLPHVFHRALLPPQHMCVRKRGNMYKETQGHV